jgi:hypothetical protein
MNGQSHELKTKMSELSDETLLQIVEIDFADYRQDALDCAKQELAARGVPFQEPDRTSPIQEEPEPDPGALVTVAAFNTIHEAYLAKSLLEGAGITAFIADEYTIGVNWLWANAVGGVKVQVAETDAEEAEKLLASPPEPLPSDQNPDWI